MKRSSTNALVNELSPKQRAMLDDWLFEHRLSYAKILARAKTQFGFRGSISALRRYYQRRRHEMRLDDLVETQTRVTEIMNAPSNLESMQGASMKIIANCLFQLLQESPEKVDEWGPLASYLLRFERNGILREGKCEENRIKRGLAEFAREKFQFDVVEKALKSLPQLRELAEARKDPLTKRYEEQARRNRLRRAMFGAGQDVEPENEQEEAEMRAARQEREQRRRQLAAPSEAERLMGPPVPSSQHYEEYMAAQARQEAEERAQQENEKLKIKNGQKEGSVVHESEKAAEVSAAKQAEREKRRKYWEVRTKFEEIRELCGWQDLKRPPGWGDIEGWKDAPFEWDDDDAYLEWGE